MSPVPSAEPCFDRSASERAGLGPREGPRRKLGIGVVGAGRWGMNLVRVFNSLDEAELVAACDVDGTRLCEVPPRVGRTTILAELLDDARIDAVVVATPPHTQTELTLAALSAGKDVFVEKPMALSLRDALRVQSAAKRLRRRVMIGFVLRYHPAVVAIEALLREGELGEIRHVTTRRCGSGQSSADLSAWWALAPHDISIARTLLAEDPQQIVSEVAPDSQTGIIATLSFSRSRTVRIEVDTAAPDKVRQMAVFGTRKVAVFDDTRSVDKLTLFSASAELAEFGDFSRVPISRAARTVIELPVSSEPLRLEAAHFVGCRLNGAPFRTDVDEAVEVVALLEAGAHSLRVGCPILLHDSRAAQA